MESAAEQGPECEYGGLAHSGCIEIVRLRKISPRFVERYKRQSH
jgi:hypothetical protein